MKFKTAAIIVVILILVAGAAYFTNVGSFIKSRSTASSTPLFALASNTGSIGGSSDGSGSTDSSALTEIYTDPTYHFTVNYPDGFMASSFANPDTSAGGDMVVIEKSETGEGAQIEITPFDEPIASITVDRIKKDLPDIAIISSQDIILGDGASAGKGVAFLDGPSDASTTNRQIWFIQSGHLYQITAPVSFDATLRAMMNTWRFE